MRAGWDRYSRANCIRDSATTICVKNITYIKVTAPVPIALAANVFRTGIFHWQLVPQNMY